MIIFILISAIGLIVVAFNILVWIIPAILIAVIYLICASLNRKKSPSKKGFYRGTYSPISEGILAFTFMIIAVIIMLVCLVRII